jgi:hypothetical protein
MHVHDLFHIFENFDYIFLKFEIAKSDICCAGIKLVGSSSFPFPWLSCLLSISHAVFAYGLKKQTSGISCIPD